MNEIPMAQSNNSGATQPEADPATPNTPFFYFNGIQASLTNADVGMLLALDSQPTLKLSMSFTVAKTLRDILSDIIAKIEESTGNRIMTTEEVGKALEKLMQQSQK